MTGIAVSGYTGTMTTDKFQIFYSNKVESLFHELKERLFVANGNPFARRMIVVPSPAIKAWLMLQMANDPDLGIAMGVEVVYPDQAILQMVSTPFHKPSRLEMTLAIEAEIRQILHCEETIWKPLLDYLKGGNPKRAVHCKKVGKRVAAMSEKLASLFERYGSCGGQLLEGWEQGDQGNWQIALWHRVWSKRNHWKYLYALYREDGLVEVDKNVETHLFGLSFLTHLQHQFFIQMATKVPVRYYLLSPCQMFWSDIVSDKEGQYLQSFWQKKGASEEQQWALDEFLRDRNPLLANFGRLGREMTSQMEDMDVEERYLLPESIAEHPAYQNWLGGEESYYKTGSHLTLLQAVQSDMALLRNPAGTDPTSFATSDQSIQVHCASSRMREVQIVYDTLLSLIEKEESLFPSEILVMAPNIMDYAPYIRAVFHDDQSVLDAQIMDIVMPAHHLLIQGFIHLIGIAESRWDAATLLQLLEFPAFQKRQGLAPNDVLVIRKWIKESGTRWGISSEHRDQLLKQSHCPKGMVEKTEVGTIDNGIGRLLAGMIYRIDDDALLAELDTLPVDSVDSSQSVLLGKWIQLIRSLWDDLEPLVDETCMTADRWASYLQCLYQSYLLDSSDDGESILLGKIEAFRRVAKDLDGTEFPFCSIQHHFEAAIRRQTTSYRESHLHAVRFCSMLPMRAIPAKAVVLMGMEEGVFPKQEDELNLNLLKGKSEADYYPSQTDFDRYLFLEVLLSARNYFVVTYTAKTQEESPSLLVTELLGYLDSSYRIDENVPSEQILHHHPFHPFDRQYFEASSKLKSYSLDAYKQALAFYQKEKQSPHRFLPSFENKGLACASIELMVLDIRRLTGLARDPIKHYLNNRLGLYLDREEDRQLKNEEEFSVSHLDKALMERAALRQPMDHIIKVSEKQGKLPVGCFKELAVKELYQKHQVLRDCITAAGGNPDRLLTIECSDIYKEAHQDENGNWLLPPLEVGSVRLVGKVKEVVPEGFVAHTKDKLEEVIKVWPEYLFFSALIEKHSLPIAQRLICTKTGKSREQLVVDPIAMLQNWIDYYQISIENPSPMIPGWTPDFLNCEGGKLETKIYKNFTDTFGGFYHDYVKWAMSEEMIPNGDALVSSWESELEKVLGDMPGEWFPKQCNKRAR